MRIHSFIVCGFLLLLMACSSFKKNFTGADSNSISGLRFIDEYEVPHGIKWEGTEIGGLSGIDYNEKEGLYYMVCDDPSARGSARFYTARILIDEKGIDTVIFTGVTIIQNREGKPYSDITKDLAHSTDLEAMRYNPLYDVLVRSSEGQRRVRPGQHEIQQPDIVVMNRSGTWIDSFTLPANIYMQATEKGPRHNSVFEGLDFANGYQRLFVCLEEPLYEDGHKAGTGDSTSWVRMLEFDMQTKKALSQYAYEIGPVPYPAVPVGAFQVNGVSDIMHVGDKRFLVIERAFSAGRVESDIRVFLADVNGAEDISANPSIGEWPVKRPVSKRLLLDMNKALDTEVYNVEGVTWGPRLANGHRSLVFVTDNNFNPLEKTQFFLFEVLP